MNDVRRKPNQGLNGKERGALWVRRGAQSRVPLKAAIIGGGKACDDQFFGAAGAANFHNLLGLDAPSAFTAMREKNFESHFGSVLDALKRSSPVAVMIIDIWQWTPFVFLVALAGLQSLPQDLYEAAEVDGGSGWQLFRHITLPLMAPTLWLILLLRLVEAFKVFDIPASLTLGGPGRATEVYSLFTYRTALRFFDHGYAAAQGFLLLVIVMTIVTILFGRIRGMYEEGS